MLHLLDRLPCFEHLKSEISNLGSLSESIARQIRAWADTLQNSAIKGQRYLTDATHARCQYDARAAAFFRQLDQVRAQAAHQEGQGPPDTRGPSAPADESG